MADVRKGMGFKAALQNVMRNGGVGRDAAGAILASAARKASPKAKAANPNLKKVKGKAAPAKGSTGKKAAPKKKASKK